MATVDELNFRLIIDDSEFNKKVKEVEESARQLNQNLSDILDIKNKVTRISKDDVASAKQQNQILKDNAKTQEAIAREVEKTAQANRKLRATTDSNIAKTQAVDQEKIAQATIKTATAQERLNQLIKRGSGELNRHSKLWQQIKNLSTVYFSVAGASRMISALVRTTAEFELQRTTLGAILQDVEKANVLYEQMKELAVKSPFNFKELATYAKQLSAYSIPVNELYDTTKMLADVSAGLGVGMDRLVLAYGQIRSASFLRGQEVRQLTEAGIPILEELRKQFVELGEEGITVGDVFDKISKRLVPFEMVSKVFTDMTSEGGKFYQMQEVQAETLRGKLSNLKDAFQIMLSEIGENQDGLLKGSVNALRALAENYEKVGRLVVTLVSTYGAYKAALVGIRIWQSAEVLAMTKGIGAYKKLGKAIGIAITESKAFVAIQKALSKINPWVAIGAAVAGLAIHFIQVGAEARKFRKELEQMANTKFTEADKSVETFQRLATQLKNSTEGSQAYRDAISQLNRQYGDYLPNLLNEKNALTEILKVENEVTNAIYARAKAYASEEGLRKIEERYGGDISNYGESVVRIISAEGYGEQAARDFVKGFRTMLENNPEEGGMIVFQEALDKYFGEGSWDKISSTDYWQYQSETISDYAKAVQSLTRENQKFLDKLDNRFGAQGYSSNLERLVVAPIDAAFNRAKQKLDSTTMSVDEYNEALNNLKLGRLYQIKMAYEDLDAESDKPGSYLNKIKEIQAQIDALKPKDLGWLQKLVNPLVTGKGNNDLKAQIEDGYDEYVDRLLKEYKAVTEVYENSEKTYQKLNEDKANGVDIEEDIIKKATEQNEIYKERKDVIEAIAAKLGVSDALEGKSSKKSGASEYDARIRAWKREAATVKEFMDTYKRWKDLDIMSDEQIISNLREIYKNTTMVESAEKKVSQTLFERIKREEGFREKAYKDTGGVWTIGYGFTKGVKEGDTITREEAEKRLKEEIEAHSQYLKSLLASGVKMSQNQYEALLDLAYNAGEGAVKQLYEKFDGNMEKIGEHLLGYRIKDRAGKVLQGLIARREREYEMFFEDSVLDSEEQEPDKLILDFDRKINGIINKLKALGDKGKEAAAQVEDMFGKAGRKDRTKDIEDAFKEALKAQKALADYLKSWNVGDETEGSGSTFKITKIVSDYQKALDALGDKRDEATEKLNDWIKAEKEAGRVVDDAIIKEKENTIATTYQTAATNLLNKATEDVRKTAGDYLEEWAKANNIDISNWSHKTIYELNQIQKVLNGFDASNLPKEIIDALQKAGIDIEKFKEAIKKAAGENSEHAETLANEKKWDYVLQSAEALAGLFEKIADYAESAGNSGLLSFANGFASSFRTMGDIAEKVAKQDYIGAIISGVTSVATAFLNAAKNAAELERNIRKGKIAGEQLKSELALNKDTESIFGTDNLKSISNAWEEASKRYKVAVEDIAKSREKLSGGSDNDSNGWGAAGGAAAGAGLGAAIGVWFFGVGALIGAAVGAVAGAVVGGLMDIGLELDNFEKSLEDMASELDVPLINEETGLYNIDTLKLILETYDQLDQSSKDAIEAMIANLENYEAAVEQLTNGMKDIFGQLADDIASKFIEAFKASGEAALDYADIIDDVAVSLAQMVLKSMLIERVFKDDLAGDIAKKIASGQMDEALAMVDGAMQEAQALAPEFQKFLEGIQQYFNMENVGESLADGIKGITEDTANLLASYLNAIRADVSYNKTQIATISTDIKQILGLLPATPTLNDYLNQIQANTFDTAQSNREILSRIDSVLGLGNEGSALRVITT